MVSTLGAHMTHSPTLSGLLFVLMLGASAPGFAESIIDGTYHTAGDGTEGAQATPCALTISSLPESHKYGDALFLLESSGAGACNWSAIGVSKNYVLSGGLVTNGGTPAFFKITFPFGPAGKRAELASFDLDGTMRHRELVARP